MNPLPRPLLSLPLGAGLLLVLAGCRGDHASSPPPLPLEEVPQTLESAFKTAPPEANQAASDIVVAVRAQEPRALAELQGLSERSDIDEAQRLAAARAMAAYLQKLREAADKGDKRSQEAVDLYRATK